MKLASALLVLITALVISIIAGYISVIGMSALFAAGGLTVILMMASLEFGKLVASGWLKFNWDNPAVNKLHKLYLTSAVVVLMLITSIGIYGFLAAGHLEQAAPLQGLGVQQEQLQVKLDQKNAENERLEKRLTQIDENISVFLRNDQATKGLSASNRLKAERDTIQKQIDANNAEINKLNAELVPLKVESGKVEAKLGPIKFLAPVIGATDTEAAVRYVILMIMFVFDPLAVVLMLAGLISLNEWYTNRKPKEKRMSVSLGAPDAAPVEIEIPDDLPPQERPVFDEDLFVPLKDMDFKAPTFEDGPKLADFVETVPEDRSDYDRAAMEHEIAQHDAVVEDDQPLIADQEAFEQFMGELETRLDEVEEAEEAPLNTEWNYDIDPLYQDAVVEDEPLPTPDPMVIIKERSDGLMEVEHIDAIEPDSNLLVELEAQLSGADEETREAVLRSIEEDPDLIEEILKAQKPE